METKIYIAVLTAAAIAAAVAIDARTEAKGKLQYRHPKTGALLPVEPSEAFPGCKCSVHYKNNLPTTPDRPAKPFRQGVIDAPSLDSIPPVPQPGDTVQTILKGEKQ